MVEYLQLMSLVAHRFGHVKFWIFVLIFSTTPACRKQQQIFNNQKSTLPNWAAESLSNLKCSLFSFNILVVLSKVLKVLILYPIIFVLNIFPNSRLIQKRIHIWQLFWKRENDLKTRGNVKAYSKRIYNYFCWND